MKTRTILLATVLLLSAVATSLFAQGTAFTYQGQLQNNGSPANGIYDLQFILFNTNQFGFPAAPILTNAAVPVNNGLFTTTLDFGSGIFTGTNFWLEISVRTNGNGAFSTLAPRQAMTPAPYAITAANLSGVVENNTIQGGVSLATIGGGSGNFIQSGANGATIGGGEANGIGTNSLIAVIAGGANNRIGTNDDTSTIGGGNGNVIQDGAGVSTIAGGVENEIQSAAPRSTISGGSNNEILNNAEHSFVGGGGGNQIQAGSFYSSITGGNGNVIGPYDGYSTISGGSANSIGNNSAGSTIDGGVVNQIQANSSYSTISGGYLNAIQTYAYYSTIGGGYGNTVGADDSTIGGGNGNYIYPFESFIGGGQGNVIASNAVWSVIGGGLNNRVGTNAVYATIAGGYENIASGMSAFVGGGGDDGFDGGFNTASGPASAIVGGVGNNSSGFDSFVGAGVSNNASGQDAVVAGGSGNIASAAYSAIGGGLANTNNGFAATVPGGYANLAGGNYSFAAGKNAQAITDGTFVWADLQGAPFSSTASNQFLIRAAGGVGVNMNNPNGASLYVQGNRSGGTGAIFNYSVGVFENTSGATGTLGSSPALRVVVDGGSAPGGALSVSDNGTGPIAEFGNGLGFVASVENDGTVKSKGVALTSDRNAKEHFTPLDGKTILRRVLSLPVTEWNYKDDTLDKRHIGPVAQDFHAAFALNGDDDKHISVVDEGGVALAAIQGLNQKLDDQSQCKDAEIRELKQQNDLLAKRLSDLEAAVNTLSARK